MLAIKRRPRTVALASTVVIVLGGLVSGCGGSDDDEAAATTTAAEAAAQNSNADGGDEPAAPLGPAAAKESIDEAEKRIAEALSSNDCDKLNELNPTSRPGQTTPQRCEYLRRIAGLESTGAEAYGDAGAVIDYRLGDRNLSAILVRDSDGLYHVAFLNVFNENPSVGTEYADEFDETAERTLRALEERDCAAFRDLTWVRFGRGLAEEDMLCEYVENNPISNLLEAQPDAEYDRAGGSGDYAFYTLATPSVNLTFVFARQSDQGAPPNAAPLPDGAAEYGFVDAYRTNEA